MAIVNTDFGSGHLVLLGGVQINLPYPYEDHFEPLLFRVLAKGAAPRDLLSEFTFAAPASGTIPSVPPTQSFSEVVLAARSATQAAEGGGHGDGSLLES